ncbi:MAG: T9SS type A sorting domain-containing protein [Bacteroidetes bacterium]|nr:T9SS type A sorting domain-containing protein [Bacteroidota bacterium]
MKNIFFKIAITLMICCAYGIAYAQATSLTEVAKNDMKYWKLRGRLTGDDNNKDVYNGFMTVGSGTGMSIPSEIRHPIDRRSFWMYDPSLTDLYCQNQHLFGVQTWAKYGNLPIGDFSAVIDNTFQHIIDPRDNKEVFGVQDFGDNPLISIGQYLAVLGTEWRLFKREGVSTTETEREIYYALLALDRLDLKGEELYGITPSLNGFLVRDDIPATFELNNAGKNIDLVASFASSPTANGGPKEVDGDCELPGTFNKYAAAMSQDEAYGLLFGCAMLNKMLTYNNQAVYNNVNLKTWNAEIVGRIINWIKNGSLAPGYWILADPANKLPVCRGPMSLFYSFPLARIANIITGQNVSNGVSNSLGFVLWQTLKNTYGANNFDATISLNIPAALQNLLNLDAYEYILVPGNQNFSHKSAYNVSMFLRLLTSSKTAARPGPPFFDFNGKYLTNTISQTYLKNVYDLAGAAMSNYNPVHTSTWWYNEFKEMKCGCNCIQNFNPNAYWGCLEYKNTNGIMADKGRWNLQDRWANPVYAEPTSPIMDEFPGLDYMLGYNLYKYNYFNSGYRNKIRRNITNANYPWVFPGYNQIPAFTIGGVQNPLEVKSVFSLEAGNTNLQSDAKVYYFAGSDIKLTPGFHAKPGAVFAAKIQEFDCSPNNYLIGPMEVVAYKTEDTLTGTTFLDFIDTVEVFQEEDTTFEDFTPPDYDSNVLIKYVSNDTIFFELNPDYVFTDSGEIIYAPANNKAALDEATINNITLFPNPSSTSAIVEYMLYYDSEVKIIVTNELGQEMRNIVSNEIFRQQRGKQKIVLNTASLNSGIYFCMVELNGRRQVLTFSVLR